MPAFRRMLLGTVISVLDLNVTVMLSTTSGDPVSLFKCRGISGFGQTPDFTSPLLNLAGLAVQLG
jgi:hypothetical protein